MSVLGGCGSAAQSADSACGALGPVPDRQRGSARSLPGVTPISPQAFECLPHTQPFPASSPQTQRAVGNSHGCRMWATGTASHPRWLSARRSTERGGVMRPAFTLPVSWAHRRPLPTLNRLSAGSNTLLMISSKNSLKTPSWSMPASSTPRSLTNFTRITPFMPCWESCRSCS